MTHTILPLNGPALMAFGMPLPGFRGSEIPMLRQAVDLDVGRDGGLRQRAA